MRNTKLCRAVLLGVLASLAISVSGAAQLAGPPLDVAGNGVALPPPPQEDWSVLQVDPASLGPASYAVIGTAQAQGFTREIVRVQWRMADPIDLYVIKPVGVKDPPVVLYLYDYKSNTDRFRDDGWCKRATQDGFAAVGFVPAFAWERFNNRPMKQWFVSELQEALGSTVHDVQMVLNYLGDRGDLDVKQVGMFGQGSSGAVAVLAAEADSRISVLDLLDPWGDWPDWLKDSAQVPENERPEYLKPEFLARVKNLDPVQYLPQLRLKALRVQQTMDDPVTPPAAKAKIVTAVHPPGQLVQYKNEREHQEAWRVSGLSGWLHDQLRPSPTPSSVGSAQLSGSIEAGGNLPATSKLQTAR